MYDLQTNEIFLFLSWTLVNGFCQCSIYFFACAWGGQIWTLTFSGFLTLDDSVPPIWFPKAIVILPEKKLPKFQTPLKKISNYWQSFPWNIAEEITLGMKKWNVNTYSLLAKRRAEDTLSTLVKFGHNDVLCLVGAGLSREVDDVGFVHLLVQFPQQEGGDVGRLAGTRGTNKETGLLMGDQ